VSVRKVELKKVLEDVVEEARVALGATIELTLPGDALRGLWDPSRLEQAVTNLVSNAVQHGQTGGTVRVRATDAGSDVVIAVNNMGSLIPPDLLPLIFDPFKQGGDVRRKPGGGLGLGLYIVRKIAQAHGGHVSASSTPSEGTTFTLTLPKHSTQRDQTGPVLVVDDDVDVRAAMTETLEAQGYRVATAADGAKALQSLRAGERPLAVLVDLHMPVMGGEALMTQCREDPKLRPIPLLIISSDKKGAVELSRRGACAFLPKPVQVESLLETLDRLAHPEVV
jgi:two-component system CheB/CheR fusion protein